MTASSRRAAGIRAFEEGDLEQVARLWDAVFRLRSSLTSPDTAEFLRRTLLSEPWCDPELPSLVFAQKDGRVIGFLGAATHRMRFDEHPIRAVSCAHFMIDPDAQVQGAGALLLGKLLGGPQDLTTTDTATLGMLPLWNRLGGTTAHLATVGWIRVFQPSAVARRLLAERLGAARWFLRPPAAPLWRLADVGLRRGIKLVSSPRSSSQAADVATGPSEPLPAADAARELTAIGEGFRLRAEYEASHLEALYDDLGRFTSGAPVSRVVRRGDRTLGAFVYLLEPGGLCPVLAVACAEDDATTVLESLFEHASGNGAAGLVGRVEAHLQEALAEGPALFFAAAVRRLLHAREPELLTAIDSGSALMTRLDGEWW